MGQLFLSLHSEMARSIHLLPDQLINQVAAGEVIERPASVVKELIENSLDAKATRIDVSFRHAGKDFLCVRDNGIGMESDDALLALERHATSKLLSFDDLNRIRSFGFRGEALPSIGSISRLVLRTRPEPETIGTEILMDGGRVIHRKPCAMQAGTEITVSHLFKTVPVRRKFLKSDQTETNHIIETVRLFAAAFPYIDFSLRDGTGRDIFRLPATECHRDRLAALFGSGLCNSMVPIDGSNGSLTFRGLILSPFGQAAIQQKSLFFVNGRPIQNASLRDWLLESYGPTYPSARAISCILFLTIPPEEIDVNVHPTKREIRFRDPTAIHRLFVEKIRLHLEDHVQRERQRLFTAIAAGGTPAATEAGPLNSAGDDDKPRTNSPSETKKNPNRREMIGPNNGAKFEEWKSENIAKDHESSGGQNTVKIGSSEQVWPGREIAAGEKAENRFNLGADLTVPVESPRGLLNWKFIGKMNDRCALFSTQTGLLFFNILFASERIEFERILKQMEDPPQQKLLFPILLDLTNNYSEGDEQRILELAAIGFTLEIFGPKLYRINAIPAWLNEKSGEAFLYDWLILRRKKSDQLQREYLAKIAASYIATGKNFSQERELLSLVHDLLACDIPNRSPAGNPIYFEIPNSDLDRRWR